MRIKIDYSGSPRYPYGVFIARRWLIVFMRWEMADCYEHLENAQRRAQALAAIELPITVQEKQQ